MKLLDPGVARAIVSIDDALTTAYPARVSRRALSDALSGTVDKALITVALVAMQGDGIVDVKTGPGGGYGRVWEDD